MTNRLTFNVNLAMLGDNEKFLRTLRAWKPKTVVLMNGISTEPQTMFQRTKRLMREWNGIVIYRRYEDGDNHLWNKYTDPANYLDLLMRESGQDKTIWYYIHNEPLPDDKSREHFMNWTAAIIELAIQRDMRLCVGNLATAAMTIGRHDVNKWDTLWMALGKYADRKADGVGQILMGVHEYTHALLPWGCADRDPRDLTTASKITRDKWPSPDEVRSKPDKNWHIYRSEWFVERIQALTGKTPQIVITEAFHDRMPNIEIQFRDATVEIDKIAGRKIKGVPTLIEYWKKMFAGQKPALTLCQQYLWAELLYPAYYLGFALFSWTHHNALPDKWKDNCDVSEQDEFLDMWPGYELEHTQTPPPPTEPPAPPAEGIPAEGWYDADVLTEDEHANIYSAERGGAILKVIPAHTRKPARTIFMAGSARQPIDFEGVKGWVDEFYGWFEPAEPPFNILPGDARWRKYKFYANGQTALVYQRPALGVRVGNGLAVGGVIVDHIPDELLTPVERTYLLRAQGVRWLVIQLATAGIGFVRERDATRRELVETTPEPPAETVPRAEYDALKRLYDDLQAERDLLKKNLATYAAWKMAAQTAYGKITEGEIDLANLMHEETSKEKVS